MPQLVKGGKWVFGWVVISPKHEVMIPPEAYREYHFKAGDQLAFLQGSKRSGGFAVCRTELFEKHPILNIRVIAFGVMKQNGTFILPDTIHIDPSEKLLTGRGSYIGLSFLKTGPIIDEAMLHPELDVFSI